MWGDGTGFIAYENLGGLSVVVVVVVGWRGCRFIL